MGKIYGEEYPESAISLAKYARIIGYSECAFFGVEDPNTEHYHCRKIWTKYDRDTIAQYLAEAQDDIEGVLNYPLSARWFQETRKYECPAVTKWGSLIEAGIKRVVNIELDVAVDYTVEPAEIIVTPPSPIGVADYVNLHVYYAGEDQEITISSIEASGDDLIITIPRCRMVRFDLQDNPEQGHSYSTVANFEPTVDVKYIDTDPSTQALLIYPGACSQGCGATYCSHVTRTACEYILNEEVGILTLNAATYNSSSGIWKVPSNNRCYGAPTLMQLNYRAGSFRLSRTAESAIVRLAHSKMPTEPCGCDVTQRLWKRDRNIPSVLTAERLECPFGLSDGAWMAYHYASSLAIVRGGIL
jgi:hypothetical protein